MKMKTIFSGDRVNMKCEFRSLHALYDHRDLKDWLGRTKKSSAQPVGHSGTNNLLSYHKLALFAMHNFIPDN